MLANLPAGTVCTLREPGNGAGPGVGDVTVGAPQSITILPGTASSVIVRNTFVQVEVKAETTTNGNLATTGSDPRRLTQLGFLLFAVGIATTFASRRIRGTRRC